MSSTFSNMKQTVLTIHGKGSPLMECDLPSVLYGNLNDKALGIQTLYMNNTNIPIFSPTLATAETIGFVPGATSDNVIGTAGGVNALDYFFVFRNAANTQATASIVQWVAGTNPNAPTAPSFTPSVNSVFVTPYYYCFNFGDFLDMCKAALTLAILDRVALSSAVSFVLDAESNTFNLSIPSDLSSWDVEISQAMADIFPFQTTKTAYGTYKIKWSNFVVDINGNQYLNTTCPLYDTIFPFDLVLLNTNLPLIPIEFISNFDNSSNPLEKSVMFMFRKINAGLSIYNAFSAENNYLFDKVHRFKQNEPSNRHKLTLTLILRTRKNENYFEWPLPIGSKLELTLNTYSV